MFQAVLSRDPRLGGYVPYAEFVAGDCRAAVVLFRPRSSRARRTRRKPTDIDFAGWVGAHGGGYLKHRRYSRNAIGGFLRDNI